MRGYVKRHDCPKTLREFLNLIGYTITPVKTFKRGLAAGPTEFLKAD